MRVRRAGFITALAVASLASCTLFVDTDGLVGESPPDSGAPDRDAGHDEGSPAEAAPPRMPCPPDAFCDDFDDGGISAGWTTSLIINGTLTVAPGRGRSAPNAVRSLLPQTVLPDGGKPGERNALLVKNFGERTKLRCSFALWIARANRDTDIASLTWTMEDGRGFFTWLDSFPDKGFLGRTFVPYTGIAFDAVDLAPWPTERWLAIEMATDFTSIQLSIDGALVHNAALQNGTTPRGKEVTLRLGGYTTEPDENEFLYDDVKCE